MKKTIRTISITALAVFILTGWVSAASAAVTLGFLGQHAGTSSWVSLAGYGSFNTNQGGPFHWVKTSGSFPVDVSYMKDYSVAGDGHNATGQFTTFCIELVEHIVGSIVFDTFLDLAIKDTPDLNGSYPAMGVTSADRLRVLWANNIAEVFDHDAGDIKERAAFQLAIWEIVYDGGSGLSPLTAGNLTASVALNSVGALANSWVTQAAVDAADPNHTRAHLVAFSNRQRQDQVGEYVAPEPGTVVIWSCFCLAGVIVGLRRSHLGKQHD
jgi:hypothetical protein